MEDIHPSFPSLTDLYEYEGKAELIAGQIVQFPHLGYYPGRVARIILRRLSDYQTTSGKGEAFGPGLIYATPILPNGRRSFCPDGSYHFGPWPENPMSWLEVAPAFAVEIRREGDESLEAETQRGLKRWDYFLAGTQVVWDVDPIAETVTVYRLPDPSIPVVFHRGETADAEPALPGWRLQVDDIFS